MTSASDRQTDRQILLPYSWYLRSLLVMLYSSSDLDRAHSVWGRNGRDNLAGMQCGLYCLWMVRDGVIECDVLRPIPYYYHRDTHCSAHGEAITNMLFKWHLIMCMWSKFHQVVAECVHVHVHFACTCRVPEWVSVHFAVESGSDKWGVICSRFSLWTLVVCLFAWK